MQSARSNNFAPRRTRLMLALGLLLAVSSAAWQPATTPVEAQQAGAHRVYLPFVSPGAVPPPPPPPPADGATVMEPEKKTGSSALAVDAQGGMHIAYRYHVPIAEGPDTIYAYCPPPASQCASPGAWQRVNLGGPADEVQLALTPRGAPRLLIVQPGYRDGADRHYYYAECNASCLDPQQWASTYVTSSGTYVLDGVTGYYLPQRSFALDPQGRPRFVFYDNNFIAEPDRYGGYYYACDADCTEQASWGGVRFTRSIVLEDRIYSNEVVNFPALTFTSAGQPRIVANLSPLSETGEQSGVYYFACDTSCAETEAWERVRLADRGQGRLAIWDIAVDAQGRPRVAFYKEDADDASGRRLHYLACNAGCLSPAGWQTLNLGLPREAGQGADIELDAQGRPRIAYLTGEGDLGYTWCNAACEQLDDWMYGIADTDEQLEQDYPVARPVTCDAGLWSPDSPVLALDAYGNPRIAYDGAYEARCLYQDPGDPGSPPYSRMQEIRHTVRVIFTRQP